MSDKSVDVSEVSGDPENMTTGEVDLLGEPVRVTEGVTVQESEGVPIWDVEPEDLLVGVVLGDLEGVDDDVTLGVPDWVWVCVTVEVEDSDEVPLAETDGVDDSVGLEEPDWVGDTVGVVERKAEAELVGVVLGDLEGVDDDGTLGVADWVWVCVTVVVVDVDCVLDCDEVVLGEFEEVGGGVADGSSSSGYSFSLTFQIKWSQHSASS